MQRYKKIIINDKKVLNNNRIMQIRALSKYKA